MEQIYYTQCPVGYGLGASNGFQIKRMTPGFPVSGDFRHLGLRAYPGGGRTLAPPVLRYRLDGSIAEIAWLTPRAHEYETERGLWGRPGGLFTHAIRLATEELALFQSWPAGLWDSDFWQRSDPEPSRGRPPTLVEVSDASLTIRPTFADVALLARGLDPERLAELLAAVAIAVRESRTLFLIAEPEGLGPLVALLTFAFPASMRPEVTFSTFHDRPEELPGYRIQGTSPLARPNRPALASLGIVADLVAGTTEPAQVPPIWARSLAHSLTHPSTEAERDWTESVELAQRSRNPTADIWSDHWLDHRVGFPKACRSLVTPNSAEGWTDLGSFAIWSAQAGVGETWIRSRRADWWTLKPEQSHPEARAALLAHLAIREAWPDAAAARGWGEAFARWFAGVDEVERGVAVAKTLRAAPRAARPAFARALLGGLSPGVADRVLRQLRLDPSCDPGMLIPLEAGAAAAFVRDGGDPTSLHALIESAHPLPGVLAAVLDAAAAVVANQGGTNRVSLARALVPAFDLSAPDQGRSGLIWALGREEDAADWLGPALRPLMSDPDRGADWCALRDRTPAALRPALVRVWLGLAEDPRLPDDAYRWGVEELLLATDRRPNHARWADTYLRRVPSGLDLTRRLVSPEFRKRGVREWILEARDRGEVSTDQSNRVDDCLGFARLLGSGETTTLLETRLPGVPPRERGMLLGLLLNKLRDASEAGFPLILAAVRDAWPGGFEAGTTGLAAIAQALARPILPLRTTPDAWLQRVSDLLKHLEPESAPRDWGWEADGLAAEIHAASSGPETENRWPLRQRLLRDDHRWQALAADARRDLRRAGPEGAVSVISAWDRTLEQPRPERFFELMLNACNGSALARVVPARVADLRTLPPLPWWAHRVHEESINDLRDGFARLVPMAPLLEDALPAMKAWIADAERSPGCMSDLGRARWRSLDALSGFARTGYNSATRGQIVRGWSQNTELNEALKSVSDGDRHQFVAWVLLGLEDGSIAVEPLAKWLERAGVRDVERLTQWADELADLEPVENRLRIERVRMVGEVKRELATLLREASESVRLRG